MALFGGAARADNGGSYQRSIEECHQVLTLRCVQSTQRFVEKGPSRHVQEETRKGEALLLIQGKRPVPPRIAIERGQQLVEARLLER